ncbi:MAG TPA: hypothetical protein VKU19_41455 [Bryobacteraceae bacterium]|nr:hypothetical protein [Bryobacteraceae bacterium]
MAQPAAPQNPAPSGTTTPEATPSSSEVVQPSNPAVPVEDKRMFGVIPNNRTTESAIPFEPITAKRKMTIAAKDSFDYPVYPTAGLFAALSQLRDQNPSFGQGMSGYGKRFVTAYADQVVGNMMTEGIVPSLLHEDPRYFRKGDGSKKSRLGSALSQILICRTDSGHRTFNVPEWGGNAFAVGLSNLYYKDSRDVSDNVSKLAIQVATDAFSNVLKEFYPDIKRKLFKKREPNALTTH